MASDEELFQGIHLHHLAICLTTRSACTRTNASYKRPETVSTGSGSLHSGSSSMANVVLTSTQNKGSRWSRIPQQDILSAPLDHPLPIRRHQRKPNEKCKTDVEAEAHPPPACKQKSKPGRQANKKTGAAHRAVCECLLLGAC